jgi:hypothetical protein
MNTETTTTAKALPPIKLAGFWPAHMDRDEARVCNMLISTITDEGYGIRVRCGEEGDVFVPTTTSRKLIQADTAATGSTCYDVMNLSAQFSDPSKAVYVGSIILVHGNGAEVISDMTWQGSKPENEAILEALQLPAAELAETL